MTSENPYDRLCPVCGEPSYSRERRPNGNDRCKNGHVYPSGETMPFNLKIRPPIGALNEDEIEKLKYGIMDYFEIQAKRRLEAYNQAISDIAKEYWLVKKEGK